MHKLSRYGRRFASLAAVAATFVAAGCSSEKVAGTDPQLPGNPTVPAQYRGAAFIMDVSATKKTVRITAPSASIANANLLGGSVGTAASPSLLGGDVIDLTSTNFVAGAVGQAVPNKILITFDLTINNKLPGVRLTTPTFPTPPAGVTGVQLFPFETSVTATSGGVTSSGNEVVVTSPRYGAVVASNDWSGEPHNFFNDVGCTVTSNDCYRYEPFGDIEPLAASTTQTVGFLIDPTVGDFRVKMILAGDLVPTATPTPGSVVGTVTSPQLGALPGVAVNVSGGFSGTTDAAGAYSIDNVSLGSRTVSLANLPANCTAPAAQNITVTSGNASTVNFSVTCTVPTGSIGGVISSSLGGTVGGVQVTVTPTGGSALPSVTTAASGAYSVTGVPTVPATGSITLANLPAGCTNPGPIAYTGLTTAGLTQDITLTCTPAAVTYPFSLTWGAIQGTTNRTVTLEVAIDMGAAPGRPDVDGANADPLAAISFSIGYNGQALDWTTRSLLSPDEFDLGAVSETNQGQAAAQVNAAIGSTSGATKTGNIQLVRFTFNIANGFSGTVTPTVTLGEVLATSSLTNVTSSVVVLTPPTLTIP